MTTEIALDRPMFKLAPCGSGWQIKSLFLSGIDPQLTRYSNLPDAQTAMESHEYTLRKALGLPDWREQGEDAPLVKLGPEGAEPQWAKDLRASVEALPGSKG